MKKYDYTAGYEYCISDHEKPANDAVAELLSKPIILN